METNKKKRNGKVHYVADYLVVGLAPMILLGIILGIMSSKTISKNMKSAITDELRIAAEQVKQYFAYDVISNGEVNYDEYSDHEYIQSLVD